MTTNLQYFPVSTFKTQPSSFMTPAVLKRIDTSSGVPIEFMELPGDDATSTKTGFYFEGPILYVLKASGNVTWIVDFMPTTGGSDGVTSVSLHVDVSATTGNASQSLATSPFTVNPTTGTTIVQPFLSAQRASVGMIDAATLGFFGKFFRFAARVYRAPLDGNDTFRGPIGVFGVWAQYDDV
jgi:hypothetical protein